MSFGQQKTIENRVIVLEQALSTLSKTQEQQSRDSHDFLASNQQMSLTLTRLADSFDRLATEVKDNREFILKEFKEDTTVMLERLGAVEKESRQNNDFRKIATTFLAGVWAIVLIIVSVYISHLFNPAK